MEDGKISRRKAAEVSQVKGRTAIMAEKILFGEKGGGHQTEEATGRQEQGLQGRTMSERETAVAFHPSPWGEEGTLCKEKESRPTVLKEEEQSTLRDVRGLAKRKRSL